MNSISNALNAYQQALTRIQAQEHKISAEAAAVEPKADFGEMVRGAVGEAADLNKQAENAVINGIQGKADIQDVVLAVSNAEMALETVVAVRDTAIRAYNTIMQMPI